jgi:hypothetical protein
MPHPSTNHLISRVRDFCRWHEKMFGDPSARGAPVEDPIGWATDKEFWILNSVWRGMIFEGNADDSNAAADALINHGLLRATYSSDGRERTAKVRVREQIVRVFAVSKSILAWRGPSPARFDEILAARHAATMQHAATIMPDQIAGASDLGEKLEQAVHMALNEVVAILGFSLDPDDRAFAAILKAKTAILSAVLNAQVRIDERRFCKEDASHDLEMEKIFSERQRAALLEIERLRADGDQWKTRGGDGAISAVSPNH